MIRGIIKNEIIFYFLYYPKVMDLKSNKTNEHLAQVKCLVSFCCVSAEVIIHTFRPHVIRIGIPRHIWETGVFKLCGVVIPPDQVAIPDALNPHLRSIRQALFLCQKRCEQSGTVSKVLQLSNISQKWFCF